MPVVVIGYREEIRYPGCSDHVFIGRKKSTNSYFNIIIDDVKRIRIKDVDKVHERVRTWIPKKRNYVFDNLDFLKKNEAPNPLFDRFYNIKTENFIKTIRHKDKKPLWVFQNVETSNEVDVVKELLLHLSRSLNVLNTYLKTIDILDISTDSIDVDLTDISDMYEMINVSVLQIKEEPLTSRRLICFSGNSNLGKSFIIQYFRHVFGL